MIAAILMISIAVLQYWIFPYESEYAVAIGPLGLAAIGAGIGLLQSGQQAEQANRQAILQANIAQNQPFTGIAPNLGAIQEPNTFGNLAGGALAGFQQGQAIQNQSAQQDFRNRVLGILNNQQGNQFGGGGFGGVQPGAAQPGGPRLLPGSTFDLSGEF